MTDVQLYFAIGVPRFTVLCSLMIGIFQLNHAVGQINLRIGSLETRFSSLENSIGAWFSILEADMKMLMRATNDLDVCLARLEERSAR